MRENKPNLAIVVSDGRVRADRLVADWLAALVCHRGDLDVDVLDLATACLPDPPPRAGPTPRAASDLAPWLAGADCFVVVVPRDHPGPVRSAIHWCAAGWRAKPVAFAAPAGEPRTTRWLRAALTAVHAAPTAHLVIHPDRNAAEELLAAFVRLPEIQRKD